MRSRLMLTALLMVMAASPPALAQQPRDVGGIPTETQRRLAHKNVFPWDLLGLIGLFGFLGLRRRHPDDSYHPAPLE
ncbi:MAG: WGxxGxxG family protein [Sphingomicrobium sp.]